MNTATVVATGGKSFMAGSFSFEFSQDENGALNRNVRSHYGNVARDISHALNDVCGYIKTTLGIQMKMGIKTSTTEIIEAISMSTFSDHAVEIVLAQYKNKEQVNIFADHDIISADSAILIMSAFIAISDDEELKSMRKSLTVFMRSLIAGEAYGSIIEKDNTLAFYIGRFDANGNPFDAIIELSRK
ncbi:MAG: hypothetical protein ACD_84C00031G0005 [uncultured bacterium]|nr:MAG: hypothetical protein ACD_84C00031G0005 [uncultured bacterium]